MGEKIFRFLCSIGQGITNVALAGLFVLAPARAQTPPPEALPSRTVEWRDAPSGSKAGRAAAYRGEVDEKGMDFVMPGNVVFGRSGVFLSGEPGKALHLEVRNSLSEAWDRQLLTDASGVVRLEFRTEGEAQVRVRSASGKAPYHVMFFAGRELPVHRTMPNTIMPMDTYREIYGDGPAGKPAPPVVAPPAERGKPVVLWVIAVLLAALVVLAAVAVFRNKTSSSP
jgi:hypothetical protein